MDYICQIGFLKRKDKFMLNINIICVGKLKEKYLKDALNEYIKRLSRYWYNY